MNVSVCLFDVSCHLAEEVFLSTNLICILEDFFNYYVTYKTARLHIKVFKFQIMPMFEDFRFVKFNNIVLPFLSLSEGSDSHWNGTEYIVTQYI